MPPNGKALPIGKALPNGKALPIGKVGNDYSSALYDKNSIIPNVNDGIGVSISNDNNTIDHSLEPNLDNLVASNENDFNYASLLAGGSLMT